MPIHIRYLPGDSGIEIVGSGVLTGRELTEAGDGIYGKESPRQIRHQLVDSTRVERFEVSPEEARACAEQNRDAAKANPGIAIAVVAPEDVEFGLSRIWEAFAEAGGVRSQVFRSRVTAEQWLYEMRREEE